MDFRGFEFESATLNGTQSILRLHLMNGTSIDPPVADDQFHHLLALLIGAFPAQAQDLAAKYLGMTASSGPPKE